MPDIRAVRKLKVEVMIGDVAIPVNAITMTHAINQLPYVEISAQLDNQAKAGGNTAQVGAVAIDLSKFNRLTKLAQDHVLLDFSVLPDCEVKLTDGEGRTLDFIGFTGRPSFKIRNGELFLGFTAVHEKAVLQCFNARIYLGTEWYGINNWQQAISAAKSIAQDTTSSSFNPVAQKLAIQQAALAEVQEKGIEGGGLTNIADWVSGIVKVLHDSFLPRQTVVGREPLWDNVHQLNELAYQDLKDVLALSRVGTTIEGLEKVTTTLNPGNLYRALYTQITGQENILGALMGMLDMFLFQLNANWGGQLWLEHRGMLEPAVGVIKAPIQQFYHDLAHTFEPPLIQCIVEGGGSEWYGLSRAGGEQFSGAASSLQLFEPGDLKDFDMLGPRLFARGRFPQQLPSQKVAGTYLIVSAPDWISSEQFRQQLPNEIQGYEAQGEMRAIADFYVNRRKDLESQNSARAGIMNYFAEFFYKSAFLGKTTANITVPLLLGTGTAAVQPGRVYRVEDVVTGSPIFEGYLTQVSHTVSVEPEGGTATTSLTFSHMRAPGLIFPWESTS